MGASSASPSTTHPGISVFRRQRAFSPQVCADALAQANACARFLLLSQLAAQPTAARLPQYSKASQSVLLQLLAQSNIRSMTTQMRLNMLATSIPALKPSSSCREANRMTWHRSHLRHTGIMTGFTARQRAKGRFPRPKRIASGVGTGLAYIVYDSDLYIGAASAFNAHTLMSGFRRQNAVVDGAVVAI